MTNPSKSAAETESVIRSATLAIGSYVGEINCDFHCEELTGALAEIATRLDQPEADLIAGGRNQNFRLALPINGRQLTVLVKRFGLQSALKDWIDLNKRESKAQRSYRAAMHLLGKGVGTPVPVAFLLRRNGNRLLESYFISVFQQDLHEFSDVLIHLLHHDSRASKLMPLLQSVASLCRNMHDAGYLHLDLGNQNILLPGRQGEGFDAPLVIDLNRGRIHSELTLHQRGADLARLNIPSNLKLMFVDMYWGGPVPQPLLHAMQRHSRLFQLRVQSRRLRHPFREARISRAAKSLPADRSMPGPKALWIWDDYSDQPLAALDRRERTRHYPFSRGLRMFRDTLMALPAVWRNYQRCLTTAFSNEVQLQDRVAISLAPTSASLDQELGLLAELGAVPVLVRMSRAENPSSLEQHYELIQRLRQNQHRVKLALLQDRQAIVEPQSWRQFVMSVLQRVAADVESIEFGHAINRVKWGVWNFTELKAFYGLLAEIKARYPKLAITGPATIDFEYPFLLTALKLWPESVTLAAVSHHLYVDRRGAPENLQGKFSALEKFALARAIAHCHGVSRVEVSEVNWPVHGTGIHSPVTPPFDYPESAAESVFDSGVSEALAADYMIRYLVLAVCSGAVDRVYWWRLVAQGYGLVAEASPDQTPQAGKAIDQNEKEQGNVDVAARGYRKRPAFLALRFFLQTLGSARFVAAELPGREKENKGLYQFQFRCESGEKILLLWAHGDAIEFPSQHKPGAIHDVVGNTLSALPVELSGSPVYLRQIE